MFNIFETIVLIGFICLALCALGSSFNQAKIIEYNEKIIKELEKKNK